MKTKQKKPSASSGLAPTGPRGLAGYCWALHPSTGVHCCYKVGHEKLYPDHHHPYTKTRWT